MKLQSDFQGIAAKIHFKFPPVQMIEGAKAGGVGVLLGGL
jgi:hypothetical protein